ADVTPIPTPPTDLKDSRKNDGRFLLLRRLDPELRQSLSGPRWTAWIELAPFPGARRDQPSLDHALPHARGPCELGQHLARAVVVSREELHQPDEGPIVRLQQIAAGVSDLFDRARFPSHSRFEQSLQGLHRSILTERPCRSRKLNCYHP